jgi:tetraacyldisaccharide 4'-kinase
MPDTSRWEHALNRIWYAGAAGWWLRPLAWLFGLGVFLRRGLHDLGLSRATVIAAPVLVVGNISVGGTGKTPLTIFLAQRLLALGRRPGIATRGHGARGSTPRLVHGDSLVAEVGDEPLLLFRRTGVPVCVAARRVQAAQLLLAQGCDVILCDDGLQHLALARDIEIAVVDGARGLGNARLLPAGPLREPPSRLDSVDLIVVNSTVGEARPGQFPGALRMQLVGDRALPLAGSAADGLPLAAFQGRPVHAVAAIGNPQRFFAQLRAAGLDPLEHPFGDHHPLVAADLQFGDDLPLLMTEKDAVKCSGFAGPNQWFVPVSAQFDASDEARLMQCLSALPAAGDQPP